MSKSWTPPDRDACEQVNVVSKQTVQKEVVSNIGNAILPQFDMETAAAYGDSAWIIVGRREVGSTTLAEDVIRHMLKHLEAKTVSLKVVHSAQLHKPRYQSFAENSQVSEIDITHEYSDQSADNAISKHAAQLKLDKNRHLILVFDECFYDHGWQKCEGIRTAVLNGKSLNISIIFCLQYMMGLSPEIRNNIDYVAVFKGGAASDASRLQQYLLSRSISALPDQIMSEHRGTNVIYDIAKARAAVYRADLNEREKVDNEEYIILTDKIDTNTSG